jgi:hypothetical protein
MPKKKEVVTKPVTVVTKEDTKQPVITCITINPNGTIFGLADSKVYLYDDQSKTWKTY